MVFVEFLEFICRVAYVAHFVEPRRQSKYQEVAEEEDEESDDWIDDFVRPEISSGTDQED